MSQVFLRDKFNYKNLTTKPGANINGILNKVDKPKEEVIADDDSSTELSKSKSNTINEVMITTLMMI